MGWDGAFAYLNRCSSQICAGDPHPKGWMNWEVDRAGRAILQPPCIAQAYSRALVDRNDDLCIFAPLFYHEIK